MLPLTIELSDHEEKVFHNAQSSQLQLGKYLAESSKTLHAKSPT